MEFKIVLNHPNQPDADVTLITLSSADIRWNDFGYNFHAYAKFLPCDEREPLRIRVFIIPFDDNGTPVANFHRWHIEKSSIERDRGKLRLDIPTTFNSMIAAEGDYQSLYNWCNSEEEFHEALDALNEITWLAQQKDVSREIARSTTASPAFQLGVIRTGAAYRAFRRGYSRALGHSKRVDEARTPFMFETHLAGFKSPHSLHIQFQDTPVVSDRVHCIVGANGTGKSQLLASLIERLSNQHSRSGIEFTGDEDKENLPAFNRVLAYTSETDGLLPDRLNTTSTLDYQHFSLTAPIQKPSSEVKSMSMARMLIDLVREEPSEGGLNRFDLLRKSLGKHIDLSILCIPIADDGSDAIIFRDAESKKWVRFSELTTIGEQRKLEVTGSLDQTRELSFFAQNGMPIRVSSGQRAFTRFSLHFLTFSDTGMLVIMDEPETHLHPNLVSAFCLLLNDVLSLTRSIAIVATHSVFVVRESLTNCNHIVRVDDQDEVFIEHVYMKTLGASPTSLSISIFGDDLAKKYHATIAKEIAQSSATMEQVIEKYGSFLSMDMLMDIRDRIKTSKDRQ